jgi:prepilin-type N-terminal cleavage/methylation domain-containing protein
MTRTRQAGHTVFELADSRGFTLVEVLVSIALVSVALIAMAGMMTTAYRTIDRSGEQTSASVLVQQRMEWLRNQAFTAGSLNAGTTTETLTGTYAGYTRVTTIADNTPSTGVKQITVRTDAPSGATVRAISLRTSP